MAGLKIIRRRLRSVNNTKKITYAMKLVSAAKLRKAQDAVAASREYTTALQKIIGKLKSEESQLKEAHPLMQPHLETKNVRLLVVGGSRGLCGGFNTNLNRQVEAFVREQAAKGMNVSAVILGRKPVEYFKKVGRSYLGSYENLPEDPNQWPIEEACFNLEQAFIKEEVDEVYVIYTKFKSAISSKPTVERILPMESGVQEEPAQAAPEGSILFEPSVEAVYSAVIPRILRSTVRQACLDTKASEHGNRMAAMDSATKNAGELSSKLKLTLNKLRQSGITGELLDIIGGSNATS